MVECHRSEYGLHLLATPHPRHLLEPNILTCGVVKLHTIRNLEKVLIVEHSQDRDRYIYPSSRSGIAPFRLQSAPESGPVFPNGRLKVLTPSIRFLLLRKYLEHALHISLPGVSSFRSFAFLPAALVAPAPDENNFCVI